MAEGLGLPPKPTAPDLTAPVQAAALRPQAQAAQLSQACGTRESIKREASLAPLANSPPPGKWGTPKKGKEQPDRAHSHFLGIVGGSSAGSAGQPFYPGVRSAFKPAGLARAAAQSDPYREEGGGKGPGLALGRLLGGGRAAGRPGSGESPAGHHHHHHHAHHHHHHHPKCLLAGEPPPAGLPCPGALRAFPLLAGHPEEASAFKHVERAPPAAATAASLPAARYAADRKSVV